MKMHKNDVVIGIAASGRTPFVLGAVRFARQHGVWTCGIANNPGAPLIAEADLGILLDTGPEVLTGSTRLKAGTAQKMALNRISTAAMVLSGKVVSNLMVDVKATNEKLRARCVAIVCALNGVSEEEGRALLEANDWSIRAALSGRG
jgi:N-acetylmuramic acid 6-phosphate etherase